jgi:uncharacterized protein (TIGR02246 family)
MITANNPAIDQRRIMQLLDNWTTAIRSKDIDACMCKYAPNVQLFDVGEPLEYFGADAVRKRATEWFSTFDGPLDFDMHDVRLSSDGDVAFSHSLNHVIGTTRDGKKLDIWWRSTVCYRQMDDKWMITHEHNSVPVDVESGKASLSLRP